MAVTKERNHITMMQYDYHIGDFQVEVDDDALKAQVTNVSTGQVLRRFSGEFAWADARRFANEKGIVQLHG